jgi:hypothetical protein
MNHRLALIVSATALLLLCACYSTRSISDSGYERDYNYRGEIKELDLVAGSMETNITEGDINAALNSAKVANKLPGGQKVLVIQSGAIAPDQAFLDELNKSVVTVPFSGIPKGAISKTLRLTAARGNIPLVLCYWGALESAKHDRTGKVVSWIPVAGMFVPDEKQQMRIRLKAIILDVATGAWTMVTPPPIEDAALSALVTRKNSDEKPGRSPQTRWLPRPRRVIDRFPLTAAA